MFLAVNNAIGTLKCELILHLCSGREPNSITVGQRTSLQPHYRLKTWSRSTMGSRPPE